MQQLTYHCSCEISENDGLKLGVEVVTIQMELASQVPASIEVVEVWFCPAFDNLKQLAECSRVCAQPHDNFVVFFSFDCLLALQPNLLTSSS